MTLEQLRLFAAVAKYEHVTRAAAAVNLTQSAVSAAVAALEARYGVKLFHRIGRRIELTDEGRQFLQQAHAVLAQAQAAELALAEMSGLKRGVLIVKASQTIASYWLPSRLVAFRGAYPQIEIKLSIGNTAQVAAAVNDGSAELGFVEGSVNNPALQLTVVDSDRLVIVVGKRHPWASKQRVSLEELTQENWILREPGSGTRSEFEAALSQRGVAPERLKIALELSSNEAVRAAVEAGAGATALSELVAAPSIRSGTLARVRFKLPDRTFRAVRHGERYHSRASEAFIALVTKQKTRAANE
jgi:DNA-binding transcriptional LysR family regulator